MVPHTRTPATHSMIGPIDAIILGDLFGLCGPCRRSVRRAWAYLRQQSLILGSCQCSFFTPMSAGIDRHSAPAARSWIGDAGARIECEYGAAVMARRAEEIQRRRVRNGGG